MGNTTPFTTTTTYYITETTILYQLKIMFMTCYEYEFGMVFGYSRNFVNHICVIRMRQILRRTKQTSCNWIDRANYRQRDICLCYHVSEWENMLLKSIIPTMDSITFKRMVAGKND